MTHLGKCPKCEKMLNSVRVEDVVGKVGSSSQTIKCASYSCPYCHTIISVDVDPYALVAEIVKKVKGK